MRLLLKIIIFIVVIVIAALIALPFFINPNDYKQEITEQVEKATGRTLTIDGDIGLSVFPWIALELGQLSLSNAEGFKAKTFADVNEAEIRIKLLPLLSKKVELDTIVLDGLTLNLAKNKAGTTNWDDLTGAKDSSDTADSKAEKEAQASNDSSEKQESASPLAGLTIAGVKLTNANISWDDQSKGEKYQLNNFNLTTDPIKKDKPTAVEMAFDVISKKPQADAHIELSTTLTVNMETQHYSLSDFNFNTKATAIDMPFEQAEINLSSNIDADMAKQLITAKAIELTVNAEGKSLPSGKVNLKVSTDIAADLNKQTASVADLVIALQDLLIKGNINASQISSDAPKVDGSIAVNEFNLRDLAKQMGVELPPMADDSTLTVVKLNTDFTASSKQFTANKLAVTLDQSNLNGQFGMSNFANPAFNFALKLDGIDVDRYLPPASEEKPSQTSSAKPAASAPAASSTGSEPLPLEPLRQINAKGTIDIGKLKVSNTHSQDIHLEINANKGLIKLNPMSAKLYQGQFNGSVNLDARGKALKLAINKNLSGVQVGPLLKDLSGDDTLTGATNAKIKLSANGATVNGIKKTLTGNGNFSFTNGAVKGINIAESIRKAKAALKGKTLPRSEEELKTDFASLTGSFTAKNGLFTNKDLAVMSPLLRIKGAGTVDLPKEGINYGLDVAIVGTSKGQDGKDLQDLKGLNIPVKITGTFSQPKPTVDLASMLKNQATDEMKAKVAEKLDGKLGGDLGGLLGGALGGSSSDKSTDKSSKDDSSKALEDKLKSFF